jgi:hypothetical protein
VAAPPKPVWTENRVRRHWDDWRTGAVQFKHLHDFHWDSVSGGVQRRSPRPMMYGYICCDDLVEGEVAHSCAHGPGPHRIKVVVVKKDNDPKLIKALIEIALKR